MLFRSSLSKTSYRFCRWPCPDSALNETRVLDSVPRLCGGSERGLSRFTGHQHGSLIGGGTKGASTGPAKARRSDRHTFARSVKDIITGRATQFSGGRQALVPAAGQTAAIQRVRLASIRSVGLMHCRASTWNHHQHHYFSHFQPFGRGYERLRRSPQLANHPALCQRSFYATIYQTRPGQAIARFARMGCRRQHVGSSGPSD